MPLPEQPEVSVGYEHLLQMEQLNGPGYELHPEGASRPYEVRELLDGVRRDQAGHAGKERTNVTNITVNIGNDVQFHGDFAVGKKIQDSFNKAQGSSSSDELKTLLGELAGEVAKSRGAAPQRRRHGFG